MKTAEQVLQEATLLTTGTRLNKDGAEYKIMIKAMEEYGKSEAIIFAEWKAKKGIKESASEGMWLIMEEGSSVDIKQRISSIDLYNLFKNL